MANGSGRAAGAGPDQERLNYIGQPNTIYKAPQSVANQNTANAVKKRRSSNPARAAMTGLGMIGKLGTGANPFMPFGGGLPLAGPAASAFLHALMNKPGFHYDPVAAGRMSSRDLRKLGSVFPQTPSEIIRDQRGPDLDSEVGPSQRTRRGIQQEQLLHPGGPLAYSLGHRETLDPDIRKRLAEVIPEDAIVHFRELGKEGNLFTDVMRDGRRISRTRGHMLPVHEAFGLPVQRFKGGGGVGGGVGGGGGSFGRGIGDLGAREATGAAEADASYSRSASQRADTRAALFATRRAATEAAAANQRERTIHQINRQQQALQNQAVDAAAAEAAQNQGFLSRLFSPHTGGEFQAERDAASPGPDFDFLQNQAASGIAGLLPGVSSSPAGTEGGGSYYDAVRLAMITGITVPQAQAYLDSMYGTA